MRTLIFFAIIGLAGMLVFIPAFIGLSGFAFSSSPQTDLIWIFTSGTVVLCGLVAILAFGKGSRPK